MDPGNAIVSTAAGDVLTELGTAGNIYGTRDADLNRIKAALLARARTVFGAVETESVLDKFFEKYGVGTDRSVEELRRVFALSTPFIHLQENAPNYKHHQNKEQTIVGKIHGAEARDETEGRFLAMLKDTVQGIRDGQISNSNEQHQVLFLRERAAFPLRLLEGMESYRFAYDQSRAQGASANPIHTRRDVREWVRINPPSFPRTKRGLANLLRRLGLARSSARSATPATPRPAPRKLCASSRPTATASECPRPTRSALS
jgi:hypothetical protein